ncbi:hypothetical protein HYT25_04315 [Candidatus Pacearchaeota archaeon]|nr:hypothetical protein [Candidatus Pacearchaeota archaeon]
MNNQQSPAYENLKFDEIQKVLDDENAHELNLCLIHRETSSFPWIMRPEPVFLLSELAKSGPRVLTKIEKFLLNNLPAPGFVTETYRSPQKEVMHGVEEIARKSTYSFYY